MKSKLFGALLGVAFLIFALNPNTQAAFPIKPVTIICSAAPGGSTDLTIRMIAKRAMEILKVPVVVENKTGGGGFIGGSFVYSASPDGYLIGVYPSSQFNLAYFLRKPPYDIFKKTPIMSYGIYPFTLAVKTDAPWKTFKDFNDYVKAHPGQVTLATTNPDSMENLPIWMLEDKVGVKLKLVPYQGGAPAIAAVLGGHANAFTGVAEAIPHIREGSMRGLATYLNERMPGLPDVPTLRELGYDIVVESRLAIYGPPGISKDVVRILQETFHQAMDSPDFKKVCRSYEITPSFNDAAQIDAYHRDLAGRTKPILIKIGKIKE